jgi:hypothetical protein
LPSHGNSRSNRAVNGQPAEARTHQRCGNHQRAGRRALAARMQRFADELADMPQDSTSYPPPGSLTHPTKIPSGERAVAGARQSTKIKLGRTRPSRPSCPGSHLISADRLRCRAPETSPTRTTCSKGDLVHRGGDGGVVEGRAAPTPATESMRLRMRPPCTVPIRLVTSWFMILDKVSSRATVTVRCVSGSSRSYR